MHNIHRPACNFWQDHQAFARDHVDLESPADDLQRATTDYCSANGGFFCPSSTFANRGAQFLARAMEFRDDGADYLCGRSG